MTRIAIAALALSFPLLGCGAFAQPPVPSLSPTRGGDVPEQEVEAPAEAEETAAADEDTPEITREDPAERRETTLAGKLAQGGLVTGQTQPGTAISLDGRDIAVDEDGNFLFGFDRDHGPTAELTVVYPSGRTESKVLTIAERAWKESRITVEDTDKVNPYKPEDLEKIGEDRTKKANARADMSPMAYWTTGFAWPTSGCISSPFGYRRIVNGEARRYHTGVDVAAPDGMSPLDYIGNPVTAPAAGMVTLADDDMFFEGGLVFIDHGQGLETALMHMSKVNVEVGTFVAQGDPIGEVGSTGRVTGPHLHWSLKWQDRLLDPELVVERRSVCTD